MKLYNTKSHKLEEFKPLSEVVKIYTCGPTVYGTPHIGNYASYIYWDLLVRALRAEGYNVKRAMNLTDVGHLTSDGDEGEDKLEKGAKREGKTVWEIADFYIGEFMNGFHALNLTEPEVIARATDYIEQDQHAVDAMTKNGYTYETSDGVYFDTSKLPTYADFAHLDLDNIKAGARVEFNSEKRNPSDFAVWKFIKPGENHAMRWDYLGRPGYPGWHLECSTIIHEELGEPIDIHTGGIDHIPVHHTNEIAQAQAAYGHDLAKYWLHCHFINIDGQKISKSLGNVYTLADLEARGFSPMDFKMWILSGHYRGERNFTFDGLAAAKSRRLAWRNRIAEAKQKDACKVFPETVSRNPYEDFEASEPRNDGSERARSREILSNIENDLNSAAAFALIDTTDLTLSDWRFIDDLFGLYLLQDSPDLTPEQQQLIKDRAEARESKDWQASDHLRQALEKQGITVKDTPEGQIWQYLE